MSNVHGGALRKYFVDGYEEQVCLHALTENSWATYLIYDTFYSSDKRESPDPYPNEAVITSQFQLEDGGGISTTYGFTSITYSGTFSYDIEQIALTAVYDNSEGGDIKILVSVDGGSNFTTILDTGAAINNLKQDIDVSSVKGKDVIVKLEILTDASGNGATIDYFALIF